MLSFPSFEACPVSTPVDTGVQENTDTDIQEHRDSAKWLDQDHRRYWWEPATGPDSPR